MACCSAEPPDRNKKGGKKQDQMHKFYDYTETFQISMCDSITKGQPCCCIGFLPCCIPCVQYHMREKTLKQVGNGMKDYICCQGYVPKCCCFNPGHMGEQSAPECCLCCEIICFPAMAALSTRLTVMDTYRLTPDPCDNRIIAFNNCMQILSCICNILAMIDGTFRELAMIVDMIADLVFFSMMGCMTAQTDRELKYQLSKGNGGGGGGIVDVAGQGGGGPPMAPLGYGQQAQPYGQQPQQAPAMPLVMAAPMAPAAPQMIQVQIPHGAPPGSEIQMQAPNGQRVSVVVPPNAPPGSLINVAVGAPVEAEGMAR